MAQSVEHDTLGLGVVSSSPLLGVEIKLFKKDMNRFYILRQERTPLFTENTSPLS